MKIQKIKKYKRFFRLGTILIIPFILYLFIYLPFHKKIVRLTKEHKKYTNLLNELGISSPSQELTTELFQKSEEKEKSFFLNDAEAIDNISKICYSVGMELSSITPTKKERITSKLGKKSIFRIDFKLSLRGNFLNLVKFLEKIEKEEKFFILDNLQIGKISPLDTTSDSLKIDTELHTFILGT